MNEKWLSRPCMYAPMFTKAIGRMEFSETRWYHRRTFFFIIIIIKKSVSNLLRAVVVPPNVRHISVWKILLYVRSEVFMLLRLFFTFPSDLFLLNKIFIFMPLALYFYFTIINVVNSRLHFPLFILPHSKTKSIVLRPSRCLWLTTLFTKYQDGGHWVSGR